MLKSISWSDYFSLLSFVMIVYYLFILYVYFKWDILKKLGITRYDSSLLPAATVQPITSHQKEGGKPVEEQNFTENDLAPIIQSYTDEIKGFLEEAAENRIVKEEILFALQQISAKYGAVYEADTKEGVVMEIYRLTVRQFPNLLTIEELRPYLAS